MKILFLSPKSPVPATDGGSLRNFHILKRLACMHEVVVITFGEQRECPELLELAALGVKVIWIPPMQDRFTKKVTRLVRSYLNLRPYTIEKYFDARYVAAVKAEVATGSYDAIHLAGVHLYPYASLCKGLPVVMDQHNVEALIWKRTRQLERNLLMRVLLRTQEALMDHYEARARGSVTLVAAVSEDDAAIMRATPLRSAPVIVVPNGVDTEFFMGSPTDQRQPGSIVFVGSMDWRPNVDAVMYFADQVLPLIRKSRPDVHFYVVGKNPPAEVRALSPAATTVTGTVDDVRPYYRMAEVIVVPLRIGGGTRLKILEACSMGQAMVSTTVGAEGLLLEPGRAYLQADEPAAFAEATLELLTNRERRIEIGEYGQATVKSAYSWESVCEPLLVAYEDVAARKQ